LGQGRQMGNSMGGTSDSFASGSGGSGADTTACRTTCAENTQDYQKLNECYAWCSATSRRKRAITDEVSGKDIQLLIEETEAERRAKSGGQRKFEDGVFLGAGVTQQLGPVIPPLIN